MALSSTADRDRKIGPTAHYTAYVWHRLGMPYADLFATPTGARLFWALRISGEWLTQPLSRLNPMAQLPAMPDYLELRHRTIEHALTQLEPDRIVELGAGLSRRGVTWAADHGVPYLEVDLPHMIEAKQQRLAEAPAELRARFAGILKLQAQDILASDFEGWLCERLRGSERPVIIAEGVLGYFQLPERLRLTTSIAHALRRHGGGAFLCDLRANEGNAAVRRSAEALRMGIRLVTRGRGAAGDFESLAQVASFFEAAGFNGARAFHVDEVPTLTHQRHRLLAARIWQARVVERQHPSG